MGAGAAFGGFAVADYAQAKIRTSLTSKYYGREMPYSSTSSILGSVAASQAEQFPGASAAVGVALGSWLGRRAFAGKGELVKTPASLVGGALGGYLGYKAGSNLSGEDIAGATSSMMLPAVIAGYASLKTGSFTKKMPYYGAAAGMFAFSGVDSTFGDSLQAGLLGAGAGLAGGVGIKSVKAIRGFKDRNAVTHAISSSVGGMARFGGKIIGVDDLKKKLADMPKFPAVLGPMIAGAIPGSVAGGILGYNMPKIQPEYANNLVTSTGHTMPMDNYTSGLSLGMHRNRKRRRV